MPVCPNCRIETDTNSDTCPICGESLPKIVPAEERQNNTEEQSREKSERTKPIGIPRKMLLIFGGIVLIVIALVVLMAAFAKGSTVPEYGLYLRDGELFYTAGGKKMQVTEDLISESSYANYAYYLASTLEDTTTISKDGKTIFFVDNLSENYALYYRSIDKPSKAAVKIEDGVSTYTVNDSASIVTYMKYEESEYVLYQYDIKKDRKEKIGENAYPYDFPMDSETTYFITSDNGKRVIYQDRDKTLYMWISGKGSEKVDADVKRMYLLKNDLKTIYYLKEDGLYKKTAGKKSTTIASDIKTDGAIHVYDTGEMYYYKAVENKEYLCYFNGKTEKTITDSSFINRIRYASDAAVATYSITNKANTLYIAIGDKISETPARRPQIFYIDGDGRTVYYIDNIQSDTERGDLHKVTVSGTKIKKDELYDTDVSHGLFIAEGVFRYFKDYSSETASGELYFEKNKVDSNVRGSSVIYNEKTHSLIYCTDWSKDTVSATLKIYDGKKSTKVADDVYDYEVLGSGNVIYLQGYDRKNHLGELYLYNGGRSIKLDSDVTAIIHVVDYYYIDRSTTYY